MNKNENRPANGQELSMDDLTNVVGGLRGPMSGAGAEYKCTNSSCNKMYSQYPRNGLCSCGHTVARVKRD